MMAATRMNSFLGGNKCILPIIKLTGSLSCGLRVVSAISNGRCWFEFGLGVGVGICVKKSAFLGKRVNSCKVPLTSKWINSQGIEPKIDSHIEAPFLTIAANRNMFSEGFIFPQLCVEEIIRSW